MSFMRNLILILSMCFGMSFVSAQGYSYESITHPKGSLESYIQSRCKENCVDADLLRMALNAAARETGVNKHILTAIVSVESNFKPKAANRVSGFAAGLMQIQVRWHREKFNGHSQHHYYDVFQNVRAGALVYQQCLKRHRYDQGRALWCYNGHQKRGMVHYVPKVLRELKKLPTYV